MMDWLSAHVSYHDWPDRLLTDCIQPLVDELGRAGSLQRFFFVRYADGGPHVRLRFGGAEAELERRVAPVVSRHLGAYLTACPAGSILAKPGSPFTARQAPEKWRANNTWSWVPYEPELARYGDVVGVDIAEEHFDFSSRQALQLIAAQHLSAVPAVVLKARLGTAS